MINGGYKILDLHNTDFSPGTPSEIPGIYEELEGTYRKATLISGLIISGAEFPDFFTLFTTSGGDYSATIAGYSIKIEPDNNVTITTI